MVVTVFTSLLQLIDESLYRGRFAFPPHTAVLRENSWLRSPDIVSSGKKAMMSIPLPLSAVSESLAVALQGATEVSLSSIFCQVNFGRSFMLHDAEKDLYCRLSSI
jgi:hypothetical protein